MLIGGYGARIFAVMGYVASWYPATGHLSSELLFSHPISLGIGYHTVFFCFLSTPCHLGILFLVFGSLIFIPYFIHLLTHTGVEPLAKHWP